MLALLLSRNRDLKKLYIVFLHSILNRHIKKVQVVRNILVIKTVVSKLYAVLNFLKCHTLTQFKLLVDIVCYDTPGQNFRFSLIYNLLSLDNNYRVFIKTKVFEKSPFIDTVTSLFPGAGWLEREVWDLFGIFFLNNLDLRRILTDYGFKGYPLRKDFPVTGFTEVVYDDLQKQVVYKDLELTQSFRGFNFKNSWMSLQ